MTPIAVKVGIDHLPQGSTHFYRISNTWALALKVGAMTVGAIALANFLAIHDRDFDTSVRNIARCSKMSRSAAQNAMDNLVLLGLADPVMHGNHCFGYRVYLSRTPKIIGLDSRPSPTEVDGPDSGPMMASIPDHVGLDSVPLKKDSEDSSLRSIRTAVPSLRSEPAYAKPAVTVSTETSGQVGFGFTDDQGVIPETDIRRIMTEIRQVNTKGDPEDYELREFITARIAFMTSADYRGRRIERGGKEVMQANRNKVMAFCMRIIGKDDFRWQSKRVDPSKRDRAESIRKEIASLSQKAETYRMKDGSQVSLQRYDEIRLDLQTHRSELIKARMTRRPSRYTSQEWKQRLEETLTLEIVAQHVYGDKATAYLPAEEDRSAYRRQIHTLRGELSAMV